MRGKERVYCGGVCIGGMYGRDNFLFEEIAEFLLNRKFQNFSIYFCSLYHFCYGFEFHLSDRLIFSLS